MAKFNFDPSPESPQALLSAVDRLERLGNSTSSAVDDHMYDITGRRHKNFAGFGQFCAKHYLVSLLTHKILL